MSQQHSFVTKYPHKKDCVSPISMIYWLDCLIFLCRNMRDGSRYLLSVLTSLFLASRYSCISFALASSSCPASRNNCRVDEFSASNSSTSCFSLVLKWHKNDTFKCVQQRIWNIGSFPYFKLFGLHQNYEITANRILYEVSKVTIRSVCGGGT